MSYYEAILKFISENEKGSGYIIDPDKFDVLLTIRFSEANSEANNPFVRWRKYSVLNGDTERNSEGD